MGMRHARHAVARATRRRATAGAGIRIRDARDLDVTPRRAGARGGRRSRRLSLQNEYATESTYCTGRIYPQ